MSRAEMKGFVSINLDFFFTICCLPRSDQQPRPASRREHDGLGGMGERRREEGREGEMTK